MCDAKKAMKLHTVFSSVCTRFDRVTSNLIYPIKHMYFYKKNNISIKVIYYK